MKYMKMCIKVTFNTYIMYTLYIEFLIYIYIYIYIYMLTTY